MSDYQNYIDNLVKQPLEIKMKSFVAEIQKIWEDNRAVLERFKGVEKDIDGRLKNPGSSVEDLSAFASELKERLPLLNQVKQNLDDLNQYTTISDALKQTIRNLGDYCMNNLSLDEILKLDHQVFY
jgi:RNAse (barnase) inhibitor barstar